MILTVLPEGIGEFFPLMTRMKISNCQLKSIDSQDFESMPLLRNLHLDRNELTVLEERLFKDNPQLEHVTFANNKIKFIGHGLLQDLEHLVDINFANNSCIDKSVVVSSETLSWCMPQNTIRIKTLLLAVREQEQKVLDSYTKYADLKDENTKLKGINQNLNKILDIATKKLLTQSKKDNQEHKIEEENESQVVDLVVLPILNETHAALQLVAVNLTIDSQNTKIQTATVATAKTLLIEHQQTLFLPVNLGERFPSIEKLSVAYSGLYEIDARNFANMSQLKVLNLTGNKLREITSSTFDSLGKLESLDLSLNNIESLESDAFKAFADLTTLNLGNNLLTSIDDRLFESLQSLEILNLNDNKVKVISANMFAQLTVLKFVDLSNNVCINMIHPNTTIKEIDAEIIDHCIAPIDITCKAQFEVPDLSGEIDKNKLNCAVVDLVINFPKTKISEVKCEFKDEVEAFSALDQSMLFMPFELATKFPKLKEINIQRSKLTTLQQHDFEGLESLTKISITFNNISSIGNGTFDRLQKLEILCLASNNIKSLPANIFVKQTNLKSLDLSGNQLKKLAANIFKSKNVIEEVEVQNNQLEFIDTKILRSLKTAKLIDLTGNLCVNLKYEKADNKSSRAFVELYGEIDLYCSEGSSELQ